MENAVELLVSPESPDGSFGPLFKTGVSASEPKKWSSLTISLLMHCALALAFYSDSGPHLSSRHNWIEVQLVASCEGSGGQGSGLSMPSTQTGEYGSKEGESEARPPLDHESSPLAAPEGDLVPEGKARACSRGQENALDFFRKRANAEEDDRQSKHSASQGEING